MVKGTAELQRPVPLYMQVVRQLRAQIASGELAEGDRIPSQREMMQIWRISMQTASKVIGALKTEGLAIPSIGRDTIVAPGAATRIAAAATGAAQMQVEPTASATYDVMAVVEMTAAPAHIAEILGIPTGRRALRRQETSLDNETPVSLTVMWFPQPIAAEAPRLADNEPLPAGALAYLVEVTGNRVARAIEEHAALSADADTSNALKVPLKSPVHVTRSRYLNAAGQTVAYFEDRLAAGNWRALSYSITGTR